MSNKMTGFIHKAGDDVELYGETLKEFHVGYQSVQRELGRVLSLANGEGDCMLGDSHCEEMKRRLDRAIEIMEGGE